MKIVAQAFGAVAAALVVATAGANVCQAATVDLNSAVLKRRSVFYRGRVKDHVRSHHSGRDSDFHASVYSGCAIFDPGNWTEQSIEFVFPIPG